jgi:hypothetical protein
MQELSPNAVLILAVLLLPLVDPPDLMPISLTKDRCDLLAHVERADTIISAVGVGASCPHCILSFALSNAEELGGTSPARLRIRLRLVGLGDNELRQVHTGFQPRETLPNHKPRLLWARSRRRWGALGQSESKIWNRAVT